MFVVDTNVLVYAANPDVEEYPPCRELLERSRGESSPWFITWGILYEFLRVITHPSVASEPWTAEEAWYFVTALVASPGLTVLTETERHSDVAAQVVREVPALRGNLMHDAHTAILITGTRPPADLHSRHGLSPFPLPGSHRPAGLAAAEDLSGCVTIQGSCWSFRRRHTGRGSPRCSPRQEIGSRRW